MCVGVLCECSSVGGCQKSGTWSYRQKEAAIGVLGIEPRSPVKAAGALTH